MSKSTTSPIVSTPPSGIKTKVKEFPTSDYKDLLKLNQFLQDFGFGSISMKMSSDRSKFTAFYPDLDQVMKEGYNALSTALGIVSTDMKGEYKSVVTTLVKKIGVNLDFILSSSNLTPLIFTIVNDLDDMFTLLIEAEANVNLFLQGNQPFQGITPLMAAVKRGNYPMVKVLTEKGADIWMTKQARSALEIAESESKKASNSKDQERFDIIRSYLKETQTNSSLTSFKSDLDLLMKNTAEIYDHDFDQILTSKKTLNTILFLFITHLLENKPIAISDNNSFRPNNPKYQEYHNFVKSSLKHHLQTLGTVKIDHPKEQVSFPMFRIIQIRAMLVLRLLKDEFAKDEKFDKFIARLLTQNQYFKSENYLRMLPYNETCFLLLGKRDLLLQNLPKDRWQDKKKLNEFLEEQSQEFAEKYQLEQNHSKDEWLQSQDKVGAGKKPAKQKKGKKGKDKKGKKQETSYHEKGHEKRSAIGFARSSESLAAEDSTVTEEQLPELENRKSKKPDEQNKAASTELVKKGEGASGGGSKTTSLTSITTAKEENKLKKAQALVNFLKEIRECEHDIHLKGSFLTLDLLCLSEMRSRDIDLEFFCSPLNLESVKLLLNKFEGIDFEDLLINEIYEPHHIQFAFSFEGEKFDLSFYDKSANPWQDWICGADALRMDLKPLMQLGEDLKVGHMDPAQAAIKLHTSRGFSSDEDVLDPETLLQMHKDAEYIINSKAKNLLFNTIKRMVNGTISTNSIKALCEIDPSLKKSFDEDMNSFLQNPGALEKQCEKQDITQDQVNEALLRSGIINHFWNFSKKPPSRVMHSASRLLSGRAAASASERNVSMS